MSIIPPSSTERKRPHESLTLQAVNSTPIVTYGTRSLTLDLGLRHTFRWVFILANVEKPILGADFLRHFNLSVDMKHTRLTDDQTQLRIQGIAYIGTTPSPSLLPRSPANEFEALLFRFPLLTRPQPVNHPLDTLSHTTSKLLALQSLLEPAACLQSVYALPAKSLNTCSSWGSSNPLPATGRLLSTWCPRRPLAIGAPAENTEL